MASETPSSHPFSIPFVARTEDEFAQELATSSPPAGGGAALIVTANVAHIVELRRNARFRRAYSHAWRATADGTPVYLYANARGANLPGRLTGSGCFAKLMDKLRPDAHRCFFVAPSDEAGARCCKWLQERGFPAEQNAYVVPQYGFEQDDAASLSLARAIRAHRATHVFFAVGAPKSEIWIHEHSGELGDCFAMCIGAGIEFFVGIKSRGPHWMGAVGMEWLFRLLSEPRRLGSRYLVESWSFLAAVWDDVTGRRLVRSE
ncbi:WecB/TagA/CpsF family glycosyltransferase [uncultured Alsobacter sp.]|uniref:WecB/TagA/CpsF family glycosyltransferase n=1 Tax=uncultured Alsobacter sp. TaxID=1748258 RepID=UPI0025D7134D|nr:WecB/TagA/CpsF family glycosyltransferase [uncultured Alsobacter sp.]